VLAAGPATCQHGPVTLYVTQRALSSAPMHASGAGEAAWAKVRAMGDIQFTPLNPAPKPVSETPHWLRAAMEWLSAWMSPFSHRLAANFRVFEIGAAVIVVALVGWAIWASLRDRPSKSRTDATADEAVWRPDAAMAAALLSDADRLAAAGYFDEAVHLLLRRSFDDIATNRPGWLTPASTAREISQATALPAAARTAFAVIAGEVERSRYALHPLGNPDWTRARAAYATFAVPGPERDAKNREPVFGNKSRDNKGSNP